MCAVSFVCVCVCVCVRARARWSVCGVCCVHCYMFVCVCVRARGVGNSRIKIVIASRELLVKVLTRLDLAKVVAGEILNSQ